jgi:hypothetical protein
MGGEKRCNESALRTALKSLCLSVLIFLFDSACVSVSECVCVCDMPISQVDFARYNE